MQPDEYGVCVTSGYRIDPRGRDGFGGMEAEAIVCQWGGRTMARFEMRSTAGGSELVRATVERRARAWIAADDATRERMQASEHVPPKKRSWRWAHTWRDA